MKVRNIFMEFLSLAKQRCSVRKYKTDEIEKEKLDKILEAARIAPTAANAQSQRLLVISSQEAKEKLSKGVNYHGFSEYQRFIPGAEGISGKGSYDRRMAEKQT